MEIDQLPADVKASTTHYIQELIDEGKEETKRKAVQNTACRATRYAKGRISGRSHLRNTRSVCGLCGESSGARLDPREAGAPAPGKYFNSHPRSGEIISQPVRLWRKIHRGVGRFHTETDVVDLSVLFSINQC